LRTHACLPSPCGAGAAPLLPTRADGTLALPSCASGASASASATASASAAPLFAGRFRYVRTLRTGPSCHVIEARDELLLRAPGGDAAATAAPLVAIKIMHAHAAAAGVAQAAALRALARADPAGLVKLPRLGSSFRYGCHVCLVLPRLFDSVAERLRAGRLPTVRPMRRALSSAAPAAGGATTRDAAIDARVRVRVRFALLFSAAGVRRGGGARRGAAPPAQARGAAGRRAGRLPRGGRGARRAHARAGALRATVRRRFAFGAAARGGRARRRRGRAPPAAAGAGRSAAC
jgi:hypothetical protein